MRITLALTALLSLLAGPLWAACTSPAGEAGNVIFNTTHKVMQYCNGTDWINTGAVIANASQTGCTVPTGSGGDVVYNASLGVIQFCNGSSWVDTSCAEDRSPGGSGCTGGKAGDIRYSSTASELQFCDSTDWVSMGWGCGAPVPPAVTSVFSYNQYTGNGGSLSIVNGLNLSGKGGLVIIKSLTQDYSLTIMDKARGFGNYLPFASASENAAGNFSWSTGSFNNNGFTTVMGSNATINGSGTDFGAWSFRESPYFLDIITYTGNNTANRQLSHNLRVSPGLIMVKQRNGGSYWYVWHRSQPTNVFVSRNDSAYTDYTGDGSTSGEIFSENSINDATIGLGGSSSPINDSGSNYVAYVFAHNPSGIIACDSYTGNGTTQTVTLGWEPQFILNKATNTPGNWWLSPSNGSFAGTEKHIPFDITTGAESSEDGYSANSTGFTATGNFNTNGTVYMYCAIRKS